MRRELPSQSGGLNGTENGQVPSADCAAQDITVQGVAAYTASVWQK